MVGAGKESRPDWHLRESLPRRFYLLKCSFVRYTFEYVQKPRGQFSNCPQAYPGRNTGMRVHNVRFLCQHPFGQSTDISPGLQAFFANPPIQMFCAAGPDTLPQWAVRGYDRDSMSFADKVLTQFRGNQFGTANI